MFGFKTFYAINHLFLLLPFLVFFTLTGCDDDGDNITIVEPPIITPPTVTAARQLALAITGAQLNEDKLTVSFTASDENGYGFVGIDDVRFNIAKLIPGSNGDASQWQNYLKRIKDVTDEFPNTGIVSTGSNESDGELIDNLDGSYQYTFATDVLAAEDPATNEAIPWEEDLTHRIGMEVRGLTVNGTDEKLAVNATLDWLPTGGSVNLTRNIVDTASCNQCHTQLALHGGNRVDTAYCVTCHNPGSPEPISGETVDFKVMIHKIHRGASLPRITAGGDGTKYSLYNSRGSNETIFAENNSGEIDGIHFPQDIRSCTNCHVSDGDKENTPGIRATATTDGDNWKLFPTIEACGSCHEDMAWNDEMLAALPGRRMHNPLYPATNDDCSTCHGPGQLFEVEQFHNHAVANSKTAAASIAFNAVSVAYGTNSNLEVTINITKDGVGINDFTDIAKYMKQAGQGHVYLLMNWDDDNGYQTSYFSNRVNINSPDLANPDADCIKTAASGEFLCSWDVSSLNNGEVIDFGTVAATFADTGVCINQQTNALADCGDSSLEISYDPSLVGKSYFDMTSLALTNNYAEKFAADLDSCNTCHGELEIHSSGSNAHSSTNFSQCTSCHNATRAAFYAGRPADLKYQVHKLHASNDPSGHGVVEFPTKLNDCQQCHTSAQIDLPLVQNPRASLTNNPAQTGDIYTSATTTVCTTCHLSVTPGFINASGQIVKDGDGNFFVGVDGSNITLSSSEQNTVNHMILAGGAVFGAATAAEATGTEACATCHAIGKSAGVNNVHGLTD